MSGKKEKKEKKTCALPYFSDKNFVDPFSSSTQLISYDQLKRFLIIEYDIHL